MCLLELSWLLFSRAHTAMWEAGMEGSKDAKASPEAVEGSVRYTLMSVK